MIKFYHNLDHFQIIRANVKTNIEKSNRIKFPFFVEFSVKRITPAQNRFDVDYIVPSDKHEMEFRLLLFKRANKYESILFLTFRIVFVFFSMIER